MRALWLLLSVMAFAETPTDEASVCRISRNYEATAKSVAVNKQKIAALPNSEATAAKLDQTEQRVKAMYDRARAGYQKRYGKAFDPARCPATAEDADTEQLFTQACRLQKQGLERPVQSLARKYRERAGHDWDLSQCP